MKHTRLSLSVATAVITGALLLSACSLQTSSDVSAAQGDKPDSAVLPTVNPAADDSDSMRCPEPTEGTALFADEDSGYCLLYPTSHTVVQLENGNTEIVVGDLMNHIDPRIGISTEVVSGRSLEQVAAEFLAGYEGFEIEQSALTLAGEDAILFNKIPGQDFYRMIIAAHDDLLYRIQIFPYDENLVDSYPQAEELYQLVVDSFLFSAK